MAGCRDGALGANASAGVEVLRQDEGRTPGVLAAEGEVREVVLAVSQRLVVEDAFKFRCERPVVAGRRRQLRILPAAGAYLLADGTLNAGPRDGDRFTAALGNLQDLIERERPGRNLLRLLSPDSACYRRHEKAGNCERDKPMTSL